ncbi:hypothetical protein [Nitrosomonas sp.]|uniref:hypothetical protein n=1 Tax=Nitrosomonas sp. TaxID=42353 RepID=UPI00260AA56C|nr:hypothetical protein [Nitrosomonas sp.]MCW5602803.1 hypothetical protein [Nitrosomonas sp.]
MSWEVYETFLPVRAFEWLISIAMCLLAVEKLQNVESFSTMFPNYNPLAGKWCVTVIFILSARHWQVY